MLPPACRKTSAEAVQAAGAVKTVVSGPRLCSECCSRMVDEGIADSGTLRRVLLAVCLDGCLDG
jgi:hypothetical protein